MSGIGAASSTTTPTGTTTPVTANSGFGLGPTTPAPSPAAAAPQTPATPAPAPTGSAVESQTTTNQAAAQPAQLPTSLQPTPAPAAPAPAAPPVSGPTPPTAPGASGTAANWDAYYSYYDQNGINTAPGVYGTASQQPVALDTSVGGNFSSNPELQGYNEAFGSVLQPLETAQSAYDTGMQPYITADANDWYGMNNAYIAAYDLAEQPGSGVNGPSMVPTEPTFPTFNPSVYEGNNAAYTGLLPEIAAASKAYGAEVSPYETYTESLATAANQNTQAYNAYIAAVQAQQAAEAAAQNNQRVVNSGGGINMGTTGSPLPQSTLDSLGPSALQVEEAAGNATASQVAAAQQAEAAAAAASVAAHDVGGVDVGYNPANASFNAPSTASIPLSIATPLGGGAGVSGLTSGGLGGSTPDSNMPGGEVNDGGFGGGTGGGDAESDVDESDPTAGTGVADVPATDTTAPDEGGSPEDYAGGTVPIQQSGTSTIDPAAGDINTTDPLSGVSTMPAAAQPTQATAPTVAPAATPAVSPSIPEPSMSASPDLWEQYFQGGGEFPGTVDQQAANIALDPASESQPNIQGFMAANNITPADLPTLALQSVFPQFTSEDGNFDPAPNSPVQTSTDVPTFKYTPTQAQSIISKFGTSPTISQLAGLSGYGDQMGNLPTAVSGAHIDLSQPIGPQVTALLSAQGGLLSMFSGQAAGYITSGLATAGTTLGALQGAAQDTNQDTAQDKAEPVQLPTTDPNLGGGVDTLATQSGLAGTPTISGGLSPPGVTEPTVTAPTAGAGNSGLINGPSLVGQAANVLGLTPPTTSTPTVAAPTAPATGTTPDAATLALQSGLQGNVTPSSGLPNVGNPSAPTGATTPGGLSTSSALFTQTGYTGPVTNLGLASTIPFNPGETYSGQVSTFGGPSDTMAGGVTAVSGQSASSAAFTNTPSVALPVTAQVAQAINAAGGVEITNPETGQTVTMQVSDIGPNQTQTGGNGNSAQRLMDLSPAAMTALGLQTDQTANLALVGVPHMPAAVPLPTPNPQVPAPMAPPIAGPPPVPVAPVIYLGSNLLNPNVSGLTGGW